MKFINTDGMAFIGPGSEWFWAMLQFTVLLVTGYAIYRQLRSQGSANALHAQESLESQWSSEKMTRYRLAVLIHLAQDKPGWPAALQPVGNFLNNVGVLQRNGHLRLSDTSAAWGATIRFWWALCEPTVKAARLDYPGWWQDWEWLAVVMADIDRQHGHATDYDATRVALVRLHSITEGIERLRLEQEMRSGVIPSWPPDDVVSAVDDRAQPPHLDDPTSRQV